MGVISKTASLSCLVLVTCLAGDIEEVSKPAVLVRGVAPEALSRYDCVGETGSAPSTACLFACSSSEESDATIPMAAVNDNSCDCVDGSDEPGTAACAGRRNALFYCSNDGAVPKYVYTSRVLDGICDCCDGSDEMPLGDNGLPPCSNTCPEDAIERQKLLERLQKGLDKHTATRQAGKLARLDWEIEVKELKEALPGLEQAHEKAKEEDIPANVAKRFDAFTAVITDMQATIKQQQDEINTLRREMERRCAGTTDSSKDISADTEVTTDGSVAEASEPSTSEPVVAEAEVEQKVVSEYAKWMDNSAQMLKEDEKNDEAVEQAKPDGEKISEADEGVLEPAGSVKEASDAAEKNKQRTAELEAMLEALPDDRMAFYSLLNKCLEKKDGEYVYKICFFESAKQDNVNLGTWHGWLGRLRGEFKGGTKCWNGPDRKMTVKFKCGVEEEIVDVSEPSSCEYVAVVHSPGACGKKTAAEVEKGMVGIKPRMPKDEL